MIPTVNNLLMSSHNLAMATDNPVTIILIRNLTILLQYEKPSDVDSSSIIGLLSLVSSEKVFEYVRTRIVYRCGYKLTSWILMKISDIHVSI